MTDTDSSSMFNFRRLIIATLVVVVIVSLPTSLPRLLNPVPPSREKHEEDQRWIDTSPYWLDRQACGWVGLCGLLHLRPDPPARPQSYQETPGHRHELRDMLVAQNGLSSARNEGPRTREKLRGIPQYVLDYAPLVHLYSQEYFWPSDIEDHIRHMIPYADDAALNDAEPITLLNLYELSVGLGLSYLQSKDDVEARPTWLHSRDNRPPNFKNGLDHDDAIVEIPEGRPPLSEETTWYEVDRDHPLRRISDPRKTPNHHPDQQIISSRSRVPQSLGNNKIVPQKNHQEPDDSGYSSAPATLILVDKGSGIVDAFWFFFYAYNLGQTVLGTRYGNHIGDWEHTMIRFESGVPRAAFFSEHAGGQAYAWEALEKRGSKVQLRRPVIYSAVGSHAMYATSGDHAYVLPFGMLKDVTDRGPLWDPSKNFRGYWYDYTSPEDLSSLEPVRENPTAPTSWFHYEGRWGDKLYGLNDRRQWRLFGQYHYVAGPQGPKTKNLGRERVCQIWRCRILSSIAEGKKRAWHS